ALVVSDMALRAYGNNHEDVLAALCETDLSLVVRREDADAALSRRIADPGVRQFLLKSLYRDGDVFRWRFNLPVIVKNYGRIVAAVPEGGKPYFGPALWVRGEKSAYIQDSDVAHIRQWFPNAEFAVAPGAGHWIHAEKPETYLEITRNFLSRFPVH
ncbi:MAG: alpha/beta hydrolase, partial [Bacteroidia bacterium]|nr:alpha/beta hydrolase [Bacteroidia bacterium]